LVWFVFITNSNNCFCGVLIPTLWCMLQGDTAQNSNGQCL
jgi:hypothetical protein